MKENVSKLKRKLSKLKFNAYTLRSKYQIPKKLYTLIVKLDGSESEDYVKLLEDLAEHYMRVRYYYLKYNNIENDISNDIDKLLTEKGY